MDGLCGSTGVKSSSKNTGWDVGMSNPWVAEGGVDGSHTEGVQYVSY